MSPLRGFTTKHRTVGATGMSPLRGFFMPGNKFFHRATHVTAPLGLVVCFLDFNNCHLCIWHLSIKRGQTALCNKARIKEPERG
jgi:hypothetical protein